MTIFYVTTGAWGTGTGTPNSAAQVDGNFYDVDQRIVGLTSDLAEGKRIDFVTYTDTDMTFHYTDSSTQTIPLPVTTLQYVGPWANSMVLTRGNLFTAGSGFYQVLEDHTTPALPAIFDPNATDGTTANNPLYALWMPLFDTLESLNDVELSGLADGDVLTWAGTNGWVNQAPASTISTLDSLTDVTITSVVTGQTIAWDGTHWINQNVSASLALNDLTDTTVTAPIAGQALTFDGSNWINRSAVDLPILNSGSSSGSLTLNMQTNEFVRVQLAGNLTITGFTWPSSSSGRLVRRIVEVKQTGSFTLTWPSVVKWAGGTVPVLTSGGTDVYVIYTFDGGATVFGNIIGQGYA